MKNKKFSLYDIIKLVENESISENYVRYLCGLVNEKRYKHQEVVDIKILISLLNLSEKDARGFIFNYTVPQLNKEFDIIKISNNTCVNIELKSEVKKHEEILEQLIQNEHYLKLLGKEKLCLYTFISATKTLYKFNNGEIVETDVQDLENVLLNLEAVEIDLDEVYKPKNVLVSPLNSSEKFLNNNYLLTENQRNIKKAIFEYISSETTDRFVGLTGGPGTGKTLLIYDLAKEFAKSKRILLVHSGILCSGHYYLNSRLNNIKIIAAKDLKLREIKDVDIVIVDEAHRLHEMEFNKVNRWVKRAKAICIFSYDIGQKLSYSEKNRSTSDNIQKLCESKTFKLTNKIRTNKELALFITCLLDMSKYREEYKFENVAIYYEPYKKEAVNFAKKLESNEEYTFISYTPSFYNHSMDYQKTDLNTHTVIGQEFEKVCMIIDDNFSYKGNKLVAKWHPNPDYLFEQLLYQGLTRVRSKLAIIITEKEVLDKVLSMFT